MKIIIIENKMIHHSIIHIIFLLLLILPFIIYHKIFYFHSNKTETYNNYKNNASIKVGLCMICKLENLYIQEFIDYYKKLGYNHIFIYDNNEINGERFEDVIQNEIDKGFVSIINYRGDKEKPQFRAFIDCYEKNNKNMIGFPFSISMNI